MNKYNNLLSLTAVAKPKLRRVERNFVPVLEKLSIEELMETNTYHRFNRSIEFVLENVNETMMADLGTSSINSIPRFHMNYAYILCFSQ